MQDFVPRSKFRDSKMNKPGLSSASLVTKALPESLKAASSVKRKIVSKMFWGRSSFYKNIAQVFMIGVTLIVAFSGFIYRLNPADASSALNSDKGVIGQDDLLQQGQSTDSILVSDSVNFTMQIKKHEVQKGETLAQIAKEYNVTIDTIRWANPNLISPFTNDIQTGWSLAIPEIPGVYFTVKPGQTMDDIIRLAGSNEFDIAEFNNLTQPYKFQSGQKLFIPDGSLTSNDVAVEGIPRGVFINPMSDPSCAGYTISRGFLSYHNGVDLAHWPYCTVVAVANGTVIYAGWSSGGEGYNVKIDHGGGITTHYYHGSGVLYVKVGDRVQQGQPIMQQGSTGNSTGPHLHFSLFKNKVAVNPYGYVPY